MLENGTAKIIKHKYWDIDVNATHLQEKDAEWLLKQLEERLKAQLQAYVSIQARAVTFAGVLSALSVAVLGGVIALYLQILEKTFTWKELLPLIATGIVVAGIFIVAMLHSIWVSAPSPFRLAGYFPKDPKSLIDWVNKNRGSNKHEVSITWDALNYSQLVLENEQAVHRKAQLLLRSQRITMYAFPVGVILFALIQAGAVLLL